MFATSSAATILASAFSDTGYLLGVILVAVVAGTIALMGLGYGIRHVKKWITGRRF
jgi:hypothetical protein